MCVCDSALTCAEGAERSARTSVCALEIALCATKGGERESSSGGDTVAHRACGGGGGGVGAGAHRSAVGGIDASRFEKQ